MSESILIEYDQACDRYDTYQRCLVTLIQGLLKSDEIITHSVTGRLKSRESLKDKLKEPDKGYAILADVTDVSGVRIITHLPDEIDKVANIIKREFEIDVANSIDKRDISDPDRFGYVSLHYVVSLRATRTGLPEYRHWDGLKAEIQIRTIIQHAWAEIEHDLGYKSKVAMPKVIRRRFFRLAALLELADTEFQAIKDTISKYRDTVEQSIENSPETVEVDATSLAELIKSNTLMKSCDSQIADQSGRPLYDPTDAVVQSWVSFLKWVGIHTVAETNIEIAKNAPLLVKAAVERLSGTADKSPLPRGIAIPYLCYVRLSQEGDVRKFAEFLKVFGFLSTDQLREKFAGEMIAIVRSKVKNT